MLTPVILSGGSGSRLWPLSRKGAPKQFLPISGELSLLEETIQRVRMLPDISDFMIIGNNNHRFLLAQACQAQNIAASIFLEPIGKNTAPAVTIAALSAVMNNNEDAVLFVLPADHVIKDLDAFDDVVKTGLYCAEQGKMVVFGIQPRSAETGYGYICVQDDSFTKHAFHVDSFVEKPDVETAEAYLKSGRYYWNSGMFMFRADVYLQQLEKFAPDILKACQEALEAAQKDLDFIRIDEKSFATSPEDSIDYAVMERTTEAVMIPSDIGWSDVGAWDAVADLHHQDNEDNVFLGDVVVKDVKNSYIQSNHRLVAATGVENCIIVETSDAVLVMNKNHAQNVKDIVSQLKQNERCEVLEHKRVERPWGAYESLSEDTRFQVKRITVKPGERLSLQMHHHRAEHWVVVHGTALVTKGEEELLLSENESIYIPLGTQHRLENPGKIPLELIEVQSGSYLGEDDIIRFDDVYGRVEAMPKGK